MPVAAKICRKQYCRNIIWLEELEKWIIEAKTKFKDLHKEEKRKENTRLKGKCLNQTFMSRVPEDYQWVQKESTFVHESVEEWSLF